MNSRYALPILALTLLVSLAGLAFSSGGEDDQSSEAGRTTLDGVFTLEQVEGIMSRYSRECASCHGPQLGGSGMAPPLVGLPFMFFWEGKTVGELYAFVHDNMPLDSPGSLSDQAYADLVALILSKNGFEAGDTPLEPDQEELAQITIAPAPASGGE